MCKITYVRLLSTSAVIKKNIFILYFVALKIQFLFHLQSPEPPSPPPLPYLYFQQN